MSYAQLRAFHADAEAGSFTRAAERIHLTSRPRPPGRDWKTFLHNHMNKTAATNFVVVPTISFKLLFGMVVLEHGRLTLV